jgi:hypothetical protein
MSQGGGYGGFGGQQDFGGGYGGDYGYGGYRPPPNPFVRTQQTYSQGAPLDNNGFAMQQYQPQFNPAARNPFGYQMGFRSMQPGMGGPKVGYAGRYSAGMYMPDSTKPPIGTAPPPPTGSTPPPPSYTPPTPTPSPTPTPAPTPDPSYTPPQQQPQTYGGVTWGAPGPYGGGAQGLMAYNSALFLDPRAAASKPSDTSLGWNRATGEWEAFK